MARSSRRLLSSPAADPETPHPSPDIT